jgi:hypothetical protein
VISGLSAAALAAPLLDIYGRNPEVFVANRSSPREIFLFGLLITLVVPALSLLFLWIAARIGGRVPNIAYAVIVGALAVAIGLVISRQVLPDSTVLALAIAVGVTVIVVLMVRRFEGVLVWFAIALPLVLIMFVSTSASSRLIWAEPEATNSSASVSNPAPIVIIQLDEMPLASVMDQAGNVNSELFPSFARLAEEGTWYRNALSSSIATTQSVPAILTGVLGEKGMSPSSVDHPDNLFTLLSGLYEMHVIEWVADMCPEDVCPDYAGRAPAQFSALVRDVGVVFGHLSLPVALREGLPSIDNAWKGFLGKSRKPSGSGIEIQGVPVPPDGTRAQWIDWMQRIINGIDQGDSPILSYAHLQAPHVPWEINPTGTHYERPEEYTEVEGVEGNGKWALDSQPALMGFQRHLFQLGFLDVMLGRLLDRLDETGAWDETMVIVVADHGASFVPGEHRRWPYDDNRDDLYRVPLFIKYPNQTVGEIRDEPVFGIDVMPTIAEVLGVSTAWDFDGVSLLEVAGVERTHEPVAWCCNTDGASTELKTLFDQVERNHKWIPDQDSWTGVAGVGTYHALLGKDVDELGATDSDELRWSLEMGADLAELEVGSGIVQTLLTGRIELPPEATSNDLVLVVNGNVAGFGFVSRDSSGGGSIRGMISEEFLGNGHNDIDILVPVDGGGWVTGSAEVLSLDLVTNDGRELEIRTEGSRRIQVDKVASTDDGWTVTGWSADVTRKQTPDMIYVFAGEELIAYGPPTEENKNVVRWFDSEDLLESGFSFDIETAQVPDDVDQLTVVAEFGTYAVSDPARLTR